MPQEDSNHISFYAWYLFHDLGGGPATVYSIQSESDLPTENYSRLPPQDRETCIDYRKYFEKMIK